jgi:hypothetical protein
LLSTASRLPERKEVKVPGKNGYDPCYLIGRMEKGVKGSGR